MRVDKEGRDNTEKHFTTANWGSVGRGCYRWTKWRSIPPC